MRWMRSARRHCWRAGRSRPTRSCPNRLRAKRPNGFLCFRLGLLDEYSYHGLYSPASGRALASPQPWTDRVAKKWRNEPNHVPEKQQVSDSMERCSRIDPDGCWLPSVQRLAVAVERHRAVRPSVVSQAGHPSPCSTAFRPRLTGGEAGRMVPLALCNEQGGQDAIRHKRWIGRCIGGRGAGA